MVFLVFGGLAMAVDMRGAWRIQSMVVDGLERFLPPGAEGGELRISDLEMSGIAGCNRFMTKYVREGENSIFIDEGGVTRRLCSPEIMEFEDTFLMLFTGYFTYSAPGGNANFIELMKEDGTAVIRLVR